MTDWLLITLKESGAVTDDNEAIVKYGLQKGESFFTDLSITVACAAFFGIAVEGVVFWLVLFSQRMYIGGYHAGSRGRCLLISWTVTLIAFWTIKIGIGSQELLSGMELSLLLIWIKAPVEADNRPLSGREREVYRRRGRLIAGGSFILALIAEGIHLDGIVRSLGLAIIVTGLGLIAALVLKRQKEKAQ